MYRPKLMPVPSFSNLFDEIEPWEEVRRYPTETRQTPTESNCSDSLDSIDVNSSIGDNGAYDQDKYHGFAEADLLPELKWCVDNKKEILALHSSPTRTIVFNMYCGSCSRWFKFCMFSPMERERFDKHCYWCQLKPTSKPLTVHNLHVAHHIHCNLFGINLCGRMDVPALIRPKLELIPREIGRKVLDLKSALDPEFHAKMKAYQAERREEGIALFEMLGFRCDGGM